MSKSLERSELIANRLIECSKNGELFTRDEFKILNHLFNRLNLMPLADAAKHKGISYNGLKKRVESESEMHISIGSMTFVECS